MSAKMAEGYIPYVDNQLKANEIYTKMTHQALVANTKTFGSAEEYLNTLVAINEKAAEDASRSAEAQANFMKFLSVTAMLIGAVVGCVLAVIITRGITKPVNRIITDLSSGAEQVAAAAGQVSAASQSGAQGASEQASSLEETSSALEEMASMAKTLVTSGIIAVSTRALTISPALTVACPDALASIFSDAVLMIVSSCCGRGSLP